MKARILTAYLNKVAHPEDEVTVVVDNSEKEFEIIGVTQSVGKKMIVLKLLKKKDITVGDSVDTGKVVKEELPKEDPNTTDSQNHTESGETNGPGNFVVSNPGTPSNETLTVNSPDTAELTVNTTEVTNKTKE